MNIGHNYLYYIEKARTRSNLREVKSCPEGVPLSVNPNPRPTNGQPRATILNHLWHLLNTTGTGHALRCTMRKYLLSWVMPWAIIPDIAPWEICFRFRVLASVAGHGVLFAWDESWPVMSNIHDQRFSQICVISNFHKKNSACQFCARCAWHRDFKNVWVIPRKCFHPALTDLENVMIMLARLVSLGGMLDLWENSMHFC